MVVHILHCNGEILKWCGKKYANLPTQCGHLEVEIPPGCYMVVATWRQAQVLPFHNLMACLRRNITIRKSRATWLREINSIL